MNQLTVIGRLTADPQSATPKGTTVCRYRIAIDRPGEGADFLNVVSFGARGENDARWLHKGRRIAVNGRLHHSTWTDPMGSPCETYECIADQVTYLDGPRRNGPAPVAEPAAVAS